MNEFCKDFKVGDLVVVVYETYNNNEPKPRKLNNLMITEFLEESIKFVQQSKSHKKYWINNNSIRKIVRDMLKGEK